MSVSLQYYGLEGTAAPEALFGGNVLAPRSTMEGKGSYGEAMEEMGVTDMRYPGGSLTEYMFDITNPDAAIVTDERHGTESDFIPLSEFMGYAENSGQGVTIVLPTRTQLTQRTDANGDRYADIDEDDLRGFVHDVVTGVYGNASITAFEIGNEYWGSGEMNATEYGRVASEMSLIVDDQLRLSGQSDGIDTSQTDVVFQMGCNYGYSRLSDTYKGWDPEDVIEDLQDRHPDADIDGRFVNNSGYINFASITNQLVKAEFNDAEIEAADGIAAHVYSRGADSPGLRSWDLRLIDSNWIDDPEFADLKIYVTEWNQKSTSSLDTNSDYGLFQSHEMLNIVEEFMHYGVDVAHVWPLIQNTRNTLSEGHSFDEMTAPGHMFSMMSETLVGKTMVDFDNDSRSTEEVDDHADIHGFAGEGDLVLYIASTEEDGTYTTNIDISELVEDFASIEARVLGVEEGDRAGSTRGSDALLEERDADDIYEDGTITAVLGAGEIMEVVIRKVVPTEEFAESFPETEVGSLVMVDDSEVFAPPPSTQASLLREEQGDVLPEGDVADGDVEFPLPLVEVSEAEAAEAMQAADDVPEDDAGFADAAGGFGWALTLLPFLALAGLG